MRREPKQYVYASRIGRFRRETHYMVVETLPGHNVWCVTSREKNYSDSSGAEFPELPEWVLGTNALCAVRELMGAAGWDADNWGSAEWSPLKQFIGRNSTVLIKPNRVHHVNLSGAGLECMVTHPTVIEAILHFVAKCRPARVIIGDAPIQDCDFEELQVQTGLRQVVERIEKRSGVHVDIRDFRAVRLLDSGGHQVVSPRGPEDFVRFDLGPASYLEEVTDHTCPFRVVKYDPRKLNETHSPGRHVYMVAREAIEADVVINLPKLKTHKKAGITGALKNVIGIVGEKAYLPHHRKGGSDAGGDAYEGRNLLKMIIEDLVDLGNMAPAGAKQRFINHLGVSFRYLARGLGLNPDVEGSWSGNDTIWRTIFDLQRIARFGAPDGTVRESPQRTIITFTDGIVAGEQNGPLAPTPVHLGIVTLACNEAAADWCHASLMGIKPLDIPQLRHAFAGVDPLCGFPPSSIRVICNGVKTSTAELCREHGCDFVLPSGWHRREGPPR